MVTYQLLNVMQHLKLEKNSKNLPSFCLGLFSENMSPVGVNPLIMSAVVAGQLLLALLLLYTFPLLFKKKVKQG